MSHEKGFQTLKVFLPTGGMGIPNESHTAQKVFSLITQSGMMPTVLQFVLISLPFHPLCQLLICRE
jgi:hypothetical protein